MNCLLKSDCQFEEPVCTENSVCFKMIPSLWALLFFPIPPLIIERQKKRPLDCLLPDFICDEKAHGSVPCQGNSLCYPLSRPTACTQCKFFLSSAKHICDNQNCLGTGYRGNLQLSER